MVRLKADPTDDCSRMQTGNWLLLDTYLQPASFIGGLASAGLSCLRQASSMRSGFSRTFCA
jgi:hypothetical protein